MIASSASAEPWAWSANARWRSSSGVSSSSSVMPITPFIGVRISWLMLARNADFSLDASSAASRAAASSCSRSARSSSSCWRSSRCSASTSVSAPTTPMNACASRTRTCGSWNANGPRPSNVSPISVAPIQSPCSAASVVSKRSATQTLSGTTRNVSGTPEVIPNTSAYAPPANTVTPRNSQRRSTRHQ